MYTRNCYSSVEVSLYREANYLAEITTIQISRQKLGRKIWLNKISKDRDVGNFQKFDRLKDKSLCITLFEIEYVASEMKFGNLF